MILSDEQRRALQYVHAANVGGYRPTPAQVDEWRLRADPRPGKRGRVITPAGNAAAAWLQSLNNPVLDVFRQNMASASVLDLLRLGGAAGTPEVREPDGPAETFLDSLLRLSWLDSDAIGGLSLTPLSRALLRAEAVESDPGSDVLILDRDNKLAYATLVGHIAEQGQALIVDPYLRAEQLLDLIQMTNASRYLIGPGVGAKETASMRTLVNAAGWAVAPHLRQAARGELHDRYIIGEASVFTLGLSMNGVGGASSTVLMPLPDEAADHVRERMERVWASSEILAPHPTVTGVEESGESSGDGGTAATPRRSPSKKSTAKKASTKRATAKKAIAKRT